MEEKTKFFTMRITEEQYKLLEAKAAEAGFSSKSEFARFVLLMPTAVLDKIGLIYEKVKDIHEKTCNNISP